VNGAPQAEDIRPAALFILSENTDRCAWGNSPLFLLFPTTFPTKQTEMGFLSICRTAAGESFSLPINRLASQKKAIRLLYQEPNYQDNFSAKWVKCRN